MPRTLILGGGMIGSVVARDLAADSAFHVTVADADGRVLARLAERGIDTIEADLSNAGAISDLAEPYDLVYGALPSKLGLNALRAVIEAGRDICDVSFMPEDALELDALAKEHGVTAVVDCGVAPGMSNYLAGRAVHLLDKCDSIRILVGGLPIERRWPFDYKAAFSPRDVIEEYTRPSRIVEHGEVVVREALSEIEQVDFAGIGTLEAFNTDGLRSLIATLNVPDMIEKTMRYPGHTELMRVFRATGFFSEEPIAVRGANERISPLEVTAALLFPKWTYEPDEADLTVMRVEASGQRGGEEMHLQWDLFDRYDLEAMMTSMARTTAFPCSIFGRLIVDGSITQNGVLPPELLAADDALHDRIMAEHEQRGVRYAFAESTEKAVRDASFVR